MKKFAFAIMVILASAASGHAVAHGDIEPKHGGIVQSAQDLNFELSSVNGKLEIYIEDHGQNKSTAGASGKLTLLKGSAKTELPLQPSGENALVAVGDAKLSAGDKAVASITFADKKTVNVRFAVK
jgi:hypothetical protein